MFAHTTTLVKFGRTKDMKSLDVSDEEIVAKANLVDAFVGEKRKGKECTSNRIKERSCSTVVGISKALAGLAKLCWLMVTIIPFP